VRAAIYCRVSTTAGQSVEMQLRDLRQLAQQRGFEIVVDRARIGCLRIQGRSVREIASELGYSRGLVHKNLANSRPRGAANARG
jgi:hypothetical protein